MLMNLATLDWDPKLLTRLRIPAAMLPTIRVIVRGLRRPRVGFLDGVPVAGALGDQQAALFGQTAFRTGRGQVHLRHRQLPAAEHRAASRCGPSTA